MLSSLVFEERSMEVMTNDRSEPPIGPEPKCTAYDPNNLSPEDEEARTHDDTSLGIDWDEIIATTQDDFEAGRFSYNSANYATQAEADAALTAWLDTIVEQVKHGTGSLPSCDAAGRQGRQGVSGVRGEPSLG
jgi:hypothetical protein